MLKIQRTRLKPPWFLYVQNIRLSQKLKHQNWKHDLSGCWKTSLLISYIEKFPIQFKVLDINTFSNMIYGKLRLKLQLIVNHWWTIALKELRHLSAVNTLSQCIRNTDFALLLILCIMIMLSPSKISKKKLNTVIKIFFWRFELESMIKILLIANFELQWMSSHKFTKIFHKFLFRIKNDVTLNFHKDELDHTIAFRLAKDSRIFVAASYKQFYSNTKPSIAAQIGDVWHLEYTMNENFADDELSKFPIIERKCVLDRELPSFLLNKNYTYYDCMKECHMNISIESCECVPPFYGLMDLEKSIYGYCSFQYLPCLIEFKNIIMNPFQCRQCETSCSKIDLEIDRILKSRTWDISFHVIWNFQIFIMNFRQDSNEYISVSVTIEPSPILVIQKTVQFGSAEFLASFGCIITLAIGYTILAVIEIILCFLRAIASYKRQE